MGTTYEIRSFRGVFAFLSNFFPCTIIYDGQTYLNLEAAFQAAKCADPADRAPFQSMDAAAAKRLGRSVTLRPDWELIKLPILAELVSVKFTSHPALLKNLLATGDLYLSEDNTWHDNYYGNCVCPRCRNIPGQNYLGHILMRFRDQQRLVLNNRQENNHIKEAVQ